MSLRVVLDTNVWISGIFFPRGAPASCLRAWRDKRFDVVVTPETLTELERTLRRKLSQFGAPPELAAEWLAFIDAYGIMISPMNRLEDISRDPTDHMILDAAVCGNAQYLVTGDQDLLVLSKIAGVLIMTPREFLDLLA